MSSRSSRGQGLPTTTSKLSHATPDQCHLSAQQTCLIFTGGRLRYLSTQPDTTPANSDDNTPDPNLP